MKLSTGTPQAGDILLTIITGPVGLFVRVGQWITGDGAPYQHTALVVDDHGTTVEAMPGRDGVRRNNVERYDNHRTCYVRVDMPEETRWVVAGAGLSLLHSRYSYSQYLSLALLGVGIKPKRLRRYIASSKRVICSQLVDLAFQKARVQLFDDGRESGDVTPGDLFNDITAPHFRFEWKSPSL